MNCIKRIVVNPEPWSENIVVQYLRPVCTFQILMGVDNRYSLTRHEIILKVFCLIVNVIVVLLFVFLSPNYGYVLLNGFRVSEYFALCVVSLFIRNDHVRPIYDLLNYVDDKLVISRVRNRAFMNKLFVVPVIFLLLRIIIYISFVIYRYVVHSKLVSLMLFLMLLQIETDSLHTVRYVYFGLVWCRMKALRQALEYKFDLCVSTVNDQNRAARSASVRVHLEVYTALLDAATLIENTTTLPIFVSLACGFPHILVQFYFAITFLKEKGMNLYIFLAFVECLHVILLPCLPGFATDRISSEVEKIKLILLDRIVDTFDSQDPEHEEVERFLKYVVSRTYKYSVWRLFDVDARLLLSLVGLCTTYLVVVVQFTHLI